ncbi:hypothetical protein BJY04DRAFT_231107 [Aspergillus karnatakaensis]|uniref:uncharacterized protein n=1 Tax=Aspergillus karnatakaensis TaxID=1810916 RepID=UPI003CCD9663
MATLSSLKQALRDKSRATRPSLTQPLSDAQYSSGYEILLRGLGDITYRDFIIPQLCQVLVPVFTSRNHISVLEIGPGPRSVLGYLPDHMRHKIQKYAALEPNGVFATRIKEWLCRDLHMEIPFPHLESQPSIYQTPFVLEHNTRSNNKFDVILFCHSLYGMKPKAAYIKQALHMIAERPEGGLVIVFHREGTLQLDGLICHQTAFFPEGAISVPNNDQELECFASFVAGFTMQDVEVDSAVQVDWRDVCRALSRCEDANPDSLIFSSPDTMMTFTKHALMLPELAAQVPLLKGDKTVKNRVANAYHPAAIFQPTEIQHVQQCVQWALKHNVGLAILGGGHSGQCLWPGVVSIDMRAFNQVHIHRAAKDEKEHGPNSGSFIVVEAGCTTGEIIRHGMKAGLTVPIGSRPSVGAGLWLQGGIGHLSRLYGLSCDAIVGAVIVSVDSGQVFCIGQVPDPYWPPGAMSPENEADFLWALKGAGTNIGIVISVTFKAYTALSYSVRHWTITLNNFVEAHHMLTNFNEVAVKELPQNCSADAYLYWENDRLHLGATMFESGTTMSTTNPTLLATTRLNAILGSKSSLKIVDGIGLFDTEIYMTGMHGGHGGSKTSSFKRCLFLRNIGSESIVRILMAAISTRPTPLCYIHLLHGGKAVCDIAADNTAFGSRDWDFACVVTGVWLREQDETYVAYCTIQWVYKVARDLLPLSKGVYGADLGPDPRDVVLAAKAFRPNGPRLAGLKRKFDPQTVLAYACPILQASMMPSLIILVTGESCAGKDYCANLWASAFIASGKDLTARVVSISDVTKREYAAATGVDVDRLLRDREYKEQHRSALTEFFQDQVRDRPRLPEEHFLSVVQNAVDRAPVAAFSQSVPESRLIEIHVKASQETRRSRRGRHAGTDDSGESKNGKLHTIEMPNQSVLHHCPSLIFNNDMAGTEAAENLAKRYLLPLLHDDLQQLNSMVHTIPNFPRPNINFRHVLGIAQQGNGLNLCTSLLQTHFTGDWSKVNHIACCEAAGFAFATGLSSRVNVPLALIRKAGKLPPPTVSMTKSISHISSSSNLTEEKIEIQDNLLLKDGFVVIVDDVLATGNTICAVLQLLGMAGITSEKLHVMVVAELPSHGGRNLLRRCGFGKVNVQSLLVLDGS